MLFHRLFFIGAIALVLQACIVLPWYSVSSDSRKNAKKQHTGFIVPSRTTMEDILLQLGEPDGIKDDESKMYYRTSRDILVGATEGGSSVLAQRHTYFKIYFDENGVVRKTKVSNDLDWVF